MIKILQFIMACSIVIGMALFGAFFVKDTAGVLAGAIAGFPIALLFIHLTDKAKMLICIVRGYWRSLMNWPDFNVSGHDYVEGEKDSLICETCGHELQTWR